MKTLKTIFIVLILSLTLSDAHAHQNRRGYRHSRRQAKPRRKNDPLMTDLHHAALHGDYNQIERLLQTERYKRKINDKNNRGQTPLHLAALKGHLKIIKILIEKGADVNAQSNNKKTPLHFASFKGNFPIMKHLIAHGANVNAQKDDGETALHIAVTRKQRNIFDVIEYLFQNNADISLTCSINTKKSKTEIKNLTALHVALISNQPFQIIQLLIKHAQEKLSKEKFNEFINAQTNRKETALHMAVSQRLKHTEQIITCILQHGADVTASCDMPDMKGKVAKKNLTSLHIALLRNQPFEVIKLLIEHAKKHLSKETFNTFINAQKSDGETALYIALTQKQKNIFEVIKYLLQNNADISQRISITATKEYLHIQNTTALHIALINKQPFEIIQLLIEHAQEKLSKEKFNKFINAQINRGDTALHIASTQGLKEIIKNLIACGANLTLVCTLHRNNYLYPTENVTVLHLALLSNQPLEVIKQLIQDAKKLLSEEKFNAFINAQTNYGQTALDIAITYGKKEKIEYLLKNGADITLTHTLPATKEHPTEKKNVTPLHAALLSNQPLEIIQLLIEHAKQHLSKEEFKTFINAQIDRGDTALHIAVTQRHEAIITHLLKNGAQVTGFCTMPVTKDHPTETKNVNPLHLALLNNQPFKIIQLIIEQAKKHLTKEEFNAFINAQTSNGDTALHIVVNQSQKETIKYLLQNNVDITITSTMPATKDHQYELKNVTPLHTALISNQPLEIIQLLVEYTKEQLTKEAFKEFINAQTNHGDTALHIAATQVQKETIRYLLENDASPNIQNNDKINKKKKIRSAFQLLIRLHEQSIIKHENPDAHRYTSEDVCELMPYFLEHDALIDLANKYNQTSLYWIVCLELTLELKTFIKNSTSKNNLYEALNVENTESPDNFGKTIWETLDFFYNPELIDILINTKNKEGKTLIDIAQERNNQEILMKLESYQLALEAYTSLKEQWNPTLLKKYPHKDWFSLTTKGIFYTLTLNYAEKKAHLLKGKKLKIEIKKRNRQEEITEKAYQLYKHNNYELRFDVDAQTLEYRNEANKDFKIMRSGKGYLLDEQVTMFDLRHPDNQKFYYWYQNNKLKFRESGTQQTYNLKLKS